MISSKKTIFLFVVLIALGVLIGASGVYAAATVNCVGEECTISSPLTGGTNDIAGIICLVVSFLSTRLMPPAIVFMVLWASFLFLTAAGQPGKIVAARTTLIWAIIGAVILIMAVPLVTLVVSSVGSGGPTPASCSSTAATTSALTVVYTLINWFSWLLGILSVGVGLYAGFLYMTSRGEPQKVATAGRVIFYAVVGILVAIIAFSIQAIIDNFVTLP